MDKREQNEYLQSIQSFNGWNAVKLQNPYKKESDGITYEDAGKLKDEFRNFFKENKKELSQRGVYRFIDSKDGTYYIGDASDIKRRLWNKARNDFTQDKNYNAGETDVRRWQIWNVYENSDTTVEFGFGDDHTEVVLLAAFIVGTGGLPDTNGEIAIASRKAKKLADNDSFREALSDLFENWLD